MQTILDILNSLSESLGKDVVKQGASLWLTMQEAKEFLAANPGLEFRNEGYMSNAPLTKAELQAVEQPTEAESDEEAEDDILYNLRLLAETAALTAIE